MPMGFSNVRFVSWNRESARPLLMAWFCSGHSPPLSQMGQSSGWLISSSSMTPCCALSAAGAARAERPAQDVVPQFEQRVDVLDGALPVHDPVQDLRGPVTALTARRALAARLVLVELRPLPDGAHHAVVLVEDHERGRAVD